MYECQRLSPFCVLAQRLFIYLFVFTVAVQKPLKFDWILFYKSPYFLAYFNPFQKAPIYAYVTKS